MTQFGIHVGKPGKSAKSSNLLDRNIDNEFPFMKAFKQGHESVDVTGAGTFTVDITHGLGYYPKYIHLTATDPTNPSQKQLGRFAAGSPFGFIGLDSYVTKEILHMRWRDTSAAPGVFQTYPYKVTFYYYIFFDKLE